VSSEHLDRLFAFPAEQSLTSCRPARPLPAQRRIVEAAVAAARRHGLRVPDFTLRWVTAPPGIQDGQTARAPDGVIIVHVKVDLMPGELSRVMLHELVHAADIAAGVPYDAVAWERRAITFSERVMRERQPW
jgi:hypothetical protein